MTMNENCAVCGCELHRKKGTYAYPSPEGRSHASRHHYVPERFFGRSRNRTGKRGSIFKTYPGGHEGKKGLFCYDCHEELLHNPVLLQEDIKTLATVVKLRGLSEKRKTESREAIAGRIKLFHEVIRKCLEEILKEGGQQ